MSIFSLFHRNNDAPVYPADTLTARDGSQIVLHFFRHASLAIQVGEHWIYVDPVSEYADYARLPKADLLLITHSHYDHFDRAAVDTLTVRGSDILCDKTTAEAFDFECIVMTPGGTADPRPYVHVEAVAAYNTTEGHTDFHPKAREDVGYVLTIGGTRIYIAGDTENTPEMKALEGIDIAFLPVNQPYTMTVDQAADAVKALRPAVFYPYHYGQTDQTTDIDRLVHALEGITEVRVRPMD